MKLSVLLLGCLAATAVYGAVIGIDFGSELIKVASVRPGSPFHIVIDESSKRLIPAIVGFDTKERVFGNSGVSLSVSKADRAYMYMHRLLGKKLDSPEVKELQALGYSYNFVAIDERNSVGIKHFDGTVFTPEELVAMSFENIKDLVVADAEGQPAKDVVLTVPSYWTQNERIALANAAEMAGFAVLSLINTNTAAAVQYGIDLKYNATDPIKHVIFYNMGSMSTEVSLVSYGAYETKVSRKVNKTVGQLEVSSVASDPFLGGNHFDAKLVDFMALEFNKVLHKTDPTDDVRKHSRPMAKLRSAASKAKKVLSANKDTPIFVVSVHKDIDFKTHITREAFIDMNKDLVARINIPLAAVLEERGLKPTDIDTLIILGGSTRIPIVQQQLKDFMGYTPENKLELGQSLNGDEAMALGAVFRAANLSTAFQVRKIGLVDTTNYPVGVRLGDLDADAPLAEGEKPFSKRAQLFKRYNRVAKRKTVAFSHCADFYCTMHYDSPKLLPEGQSPDISYWNVTGLTDMCKDPKYAELLKTQKPRVAVSFTLTSSGTVALAKIEATLEEMTKVPKDKKRAKKEKKEKEAAEKAKREAEAGSSEGSGEKAKEEEKKEEEKEETSAEGAEIEYVDKKITHKVDLSYVMGYPAGTVMPMSPEDILASRKILSKFTASDQLMKKIALSKNELEGHIYEVRAHSYEDNFEEVTTEEQREEIGAALKAAEEWLFEQEDNGFEKFKDKHKAIKEMSQPVYTRIKEMIERPKAIEQSTTLLNYTRTMVKDFEKERPWIPEDDKKKVMGMVEEVETWLKEKTVLQAAKKDHEMPAWYSNELLAKLRPVAKFSAELLRRPKPIPKKKRRKATKKNGTDTDSNSTETEEKEGDATEEVPKEGEEKKEEKKEGEEKKEDEKKEL